MEARAIQGRKLYLCLASESTIESNVSIGLQLQYIIRMKSANATRAESLWKLKAAEARRGLCQGHLSLHLVLETVFLDDEEALMNMLITCLTHALFPHS